MAQLSSAMQQTNRSASLHAVSQHGGSFHFSWTDAQKGWVEDMNLYQRPGLSELKWLHPVSKGRCTWGNPPRIPSVYCLVGQLGQLFTGQQGLHHLPQLGCHCWASESYFCLLVTLALSQTGPQEVRLGGEEALQVSGGNHTISVLLTKITHPLTKRNWPGTSFPPHTPALLP